MTIELWPPDPLTVDSDLDRLAGLLQACVQAGASVSFVMPFSRADARAFWSAQVWPAVVAGTRALLLARTADDIIGTVQLDLATPPNQPHRAEVRKLLVHPHSRRQGIARALMIAIEAQARSARRTLLTLDTVTGGPAERLYLSLGYTAIGAIPNYALNSAATALEPTTVMYKQLNP